MRSFFKDRMGASKDWGSKHNPKLHDLVFLCDVLLQVLCDSLCCVTPFLIRDREPNGRPKSSYHWSPTWWWTKEFIGGDLQEYEWGVPYRTMNDSKAAISLEVHPGMNDRSIKLEPWRWQYIITTVVLTACIIWGGSTLWQGLPELSPAF